MLRRKKVLPTAPLAFISPSSFAVAWSTTELGSGLPATATSTSRGGAATMSWGAWALAT